MYFSNNIIPTISWLAYREKRLHIFEANPLQDIDGYIAE